MATSVALHRTFAPLRPMCARLLLAGPRGVAEIANILGVSISSSCPSNQTAIAATSAVPPPASASASASAAAVSAPAGVEEHTLAVAAVHAPPPGDLHDAEGAAVPASTDAAPGPGAATAGVSKLAQPGMALATSDALDMSTSATSPAVPPTGTSEQVPPLLREGAHPQEPQRATTAFDTGASAAPASGTAEAFSSLIQHGLQKATDGTSGSFAVCGVAPSVLPGLTVDGIGMLALPLQAAQAVSLAAAAERAPFGRKEATVYDDDVRKTWQLPPSKFKIANPAWESQMLAPVLREVKAGLSCGASDDVRAELYKLLLYDPGSHFKPHRDTEKAPGMFATLVIVLPSQWTGGELLVRHAGTEVAFAPTVDTAFTFRYIAFFADCEHEVKPVTSGYRLALVYNVTVHGKRAPVPPAISQPAVELVASGLAKWARQMAVPSCASREGGNTAPPHKYVLFLLEHQYTEADLAPSRLKGSDRMRAEVLARAAAATPGTCELDFALSTAASATACRIDLYRSVCALHVSSCCRCCRVPRAC